MDWNWTKNRILGKRTELRQCAMKRSDDVGPVDHYTGIDFQRMVWDHCLLT